MRELYILLIAGRFRRQVLPLSWQREMAEPMLAVLPPLRDQESLL